jgi:hypothetical protein
MPTVQFYFQMKYTKNSKSFFINRINLSFYTTIILYLKIISGLNNNISYTSPNIYFL